MLVDKAVVDMTYVARVLNGKRADNATNHNCCNGSWIACKKRETTILNCEPEKKKAMWKNS